MKNKILALLASVGLVASASALEINENLSINGFIDGSYKNTDGNGGNDGQEIGIDEIELNFLFNHGAVSGAIHIDDYDGTEDGTPYQGNGDSTSSELDIEQAHITYTLDNGVSFTLGRYGSALGFEREDPAGLYTFSRAYSANGAQFNLGDVDSFVYEGLAVAYATDTFAIRVSIDEETDENLSNSDLDAEIAVSYTGLENVTIGVGYRFDNEQNNAQENDVLNVHISTTFGKLFLAAEYTEIQSDNFGGNPSSDRDFDGYLLLADYDFNEKLGAALRISDNELPALGTNGNDSRITIAPNYAITDNLGAIIEFSDVDVNGDDSNEFAVELTYTF
jgi:hypothetical protein